MPNVRSRSLGLALPLAAALVTPVGSEPTRAAPEHGFFDVRKFGSRKEPITVTSDTLEYDYKSNIVVYRGDVLATQGEVRLKSDVLTITFEGRDAGKPAAKVGAAEAHGSGTERLREIVAVGNVRLENGTRWATGGRAVFEQARRTLVLTENPRLHDGTNEVAGDRVVVYLDEDRSVVEGGRKRVKAVLHPGNEPGLAPAPPKDAAGGPAADAGTSSGATARTEGP